MPSDAIKQVTDEIKLSPLFTIHLSKSTDIASCSQLLDFVSCMSEEDVKEEVLTGTALETTTITQDVMDKI